MTFDTSHGTGTAPASGRRSTSDVLAVIRRRWLIVAVSVVLVAGAAYVYSVEQKSVYAASADVLLSRQNLATSLSNINDPQTNIADYTRVAQTQADLATAPAVIALALRTAGLPQSQSRDLTSHSTVMAKPTADILTFRVEDGDPTMADRLASAYARSYTTYRRTVDTFGVTRALAEVHQRIQSLGQDPRQNRQLLGSLRENEQRLSTLEALQTSNAFVVRFPGLAERVSPKPKLALLIGLFFGAILGVGLALLRHSLDTRVQDPEGVSTELDLAQLGRIPELSKRQRQLHDLPMRSEPDSPTAEAFRVLRTNVEFAIIDGRIKSIMVTSAVQTEGKSTTVANLAYAFARAGRHVILVDLDLRRPYIAKFFGLVGRPGLTDVALGRLPLEDALHPVDISTHRDPANAVVAFEGNGHSPDADESAVVVGADHEHSSLRVLPCGAAPPDTGEFIGSEWLQTVLSKLEQDADIVLVDAPPLLSVGDALALTARVDALLLVARLTIVRRPMLREVRRILSSSPIQVLGSVVTGVQANQGYGYAYSYAAADDDTSSGSVRPRRWRRPLGAARSSADE